ncbi:hypothetical protein [Bradyrhizobium sp. ORS 111]|uniref:hypothetical protein n=1 Tax=Bradyrhizobium sp. ORS 111 TaxID=1685958 RepID=UPI00388F6501
MESNARAEDKPCAKDVTLVIQAEGQSVASNAWHVPCKYLIQESLETARKEIDEIANSKAWFDAAWSARGRHGVR